MGPNKANKLLHSKGNHKQDKKTTYRIEDICKQCDQQGLNFENIQTAHTTWQQKKKQKTHPKMRGPKDIAPKKKDRWLTGMWKDTQLWLIVREMQIKTTVSEQLIPVRKVII